MRRKSLRAFSLTLSAVMVLSVANPGVTALATEANSAIEQQVQTSVSEEAEEVTEDVTEATAEVVATEEVTAEMTTEDAATEVATEVTTVEKDTEAVTTEEVATEQKLTPEIEDVPAPQRATTDTTKLLKNVIENQTLVDMVVEIYNRSATTQLTKDNITVGDLQAYSGELIFEPTLVQVNAVTSLKGLGDARNATIIDVSQFTKVTEIEAGEFSGCAFTTFKMPDSITSIGGNAFDGCVNLATIYTGDKENTLPEGLVSVGKEVFASDNALTMITIPTLTDEDAVGMFQFCNNLQTVVLGDGVTKIPMSAFLNAGNGEGAPGISITFGTGLDKILNRAFEGVNFAPDSVIDLSRCSKLNGIDVSAFNSAKNISTVILPANNAILEFGDYAFANTTLTSMYPAGSNVSGVYLPDYTAAALGQGIFYGNTSMTEVSLPAALNEIPDYAFDGCSALATVTQRQKDNNCNVRLIGDCAFRGTAITNTDFMKSMNQLVQIGRQLHTKTDKISGVNIRTSQVNSIPAGGVNDGKFVTTDASCKKYNGREVGSEVFTGCYSLEKITIPASVQVIGNRAFYFAKDKQTSILKEVEWLSATSSISGGVRVISPEAFAGNTALTTIVLPNNKGESLEIGKAAFCDNYSLTTIGAAGTTDNTLPDTVSSIGEAAFYKCTSLDEIHIQSYHGDTMPTLNPRTFEYCWRLNKATLPKQTTEIPYHFFAVCPLTSFNFSEMTNLTLIDTLAFVGNQFQTVDLSVCTKLEELGAGSLAFRDGIQSNYGEVNYNIDVNPQEKVNDVGATSPVLTTVILPKSVTSGGVFIDSGVFDTQTNFNTLYKYGSETAGKVVIPDYVLPGTGSEIPEMLFGFSGVSHVIWEADTNPAAAANQWKTIANAMFVGCVQIQDAKDVLPKYVEKIGQAAFYGSGIQSADLSGFNNLTHLSINVGTAQNKGAFQACPLLEEVKLPSSVADGITLDMYTFADSQALQSVDLGATKTIGTYAFQNCIALPTIDFKNVTQIGGYSFKKCSSLATVQFGSVLEKIDNYAFDSCVSLDLKDTPLPASLLTIGYGAFMNSGITGVDFSKAAALSSIGNNAFENTQIKEFNISGTKVTTIPSNMLLKCSLLEKASFGEEVQYISENALAGCPVFAELKFYSTTTVDQKIFYTQGTDGAVTGQANGRSTSDTDISIKIEVVTPNEIQIPVGRETEFPYYINSKGTSDIQYLSIIDRAAEDDLSVEDALYIRAKSNGYYKIQNSDEENGKYKVNPAYFEQLAVAETVRRNNRDVDVIRVTGLKESANRDLEFNIYADMQFECQKKGVSIKSTSFGAKYNVKVVDPKTTTVLYSDAKRTMEIGSTYNVQAINSSKGAFPCYYDLKDAVVTDVPIDEFNIIVETSNPDVVCVGANTMAKETSYAVNATDANGRTQDGRKYFYINPQGIGTAILSVYLQDSNGNKMEKSKKTYTINVNTDIQSIVLKIPTEYNNKINPGASFSVFSEYRNYFGQTCKVDEMINFTKYTNRKIIFTSSDPDYVSVDQLGRVTILKADQVAKRVTITATAATGVEGRTTQASVVLNVAYPVINAILK